MINKITNLLIYLLRYFSIINPTYEVSSSINFGSKVCDNYFKKLLKRSKFYFEYGGGSSTLLANKLNKRFISVETDKSFYSFLKNKGINQVVYSDIGPTKYYSVPLVPTFFIKKKIRKYANQINFINNNLKFFPDLILIDGRFRVYVAIQVIIFCLKNINKNKTVIIIDDFKFRKEYHILKKLIKIKLVGRFGVIQITKKVKVSSNKAKKLSDKFILYHF
tara:strand:+ start:889 stop:1548 length:660 start_codon:yes stop_codon:yes gene_type:complete